MLTIKNHHKLEDRYVVDNWKVATMCEGIHNDTYLIRLHKVDSSRILDACTVMLERNGILQKSMTHPDEMAYYFIFDSQRTNVCAGAEWLGDIDNMIGQLRHLLRENNKANY